jgi:hypothetical protein
MRLNCRGHNLHFPEIKVFRLSGPFYLETFFQAFLFFAAKRKTSCGRSLAYPVWRRWSLLLRLHKADSPSKVLRTMQIVSVSFTCHSSSHEAHTCNTDYPRKLREWGRCLDANLTQDLIMKFYGDTSLHLLLPVSQGLHHLSYAHSYSPGEYGTPVCCDWFCGCKSWKCDGSYRPITLYYNYPAALTAKYGVLYHFDWFIRHTSQGPVVWTNSVTCPVSQPLWPKTFGESKKQLKKGIYCTY